MQGSSCKLWEEPDCGHIEVNAGLLCIVLAIVGGYRLKNFEELKIQFEDFIHLKEPCLNVASLRTV